MKVPDDKILKNKEVCERLNVSDYERKQLIAAGILEAPIDTGARFPRHTLTQLIRAQDRIAEKARATLSRSRQGRKIKPLTARAISELRGFR